TTAHARASGDGESSQSLPHEAVKPDPQPSSEAVNAIVELLHDAGVIPRPTRALLEAPQDARAPRLARIRAELEVAHDRDPDAYAIRSAELAFLANVIAAGASIQSRPVRTEEATDAVMAICNLGLENWPERWVA